MSNCPFSLEVSMMYRKGVKRVIDISVSVLAILILSPLLLVTAMIILLLLGRPIFYTQQRPGLHGIPFRIIKFRTMRNSVDSKGQSLPDEDRLIKVGRFLRSTSIDELPELLNILIGQMSLIGPRPLLMEYLPLYSKEQMRRHEVRPGLTGLAQVNGRNSLSWEERLVYDVDYVNHVSLWLDVKIVIKSIIVVLSRKGIEYQGTVSDEKFKGTHHEK